MFKRIHSLERELQKAGGSGAQEAQSQQGTASPGQGKPLNVRLFLPLQLAQQINLLGKLERQKESHIR